MMRVVALVVMLVLLPSCAYYDPLGIRREAVRQPGLIAVPESYTKSEVDAINAETVCRLQSRNVLEAGRCGVRR